MVTASDHSGSSPPARVLYTSVSSRGRTPGFVVARDLREARARLGQDGHTEIRFWSHPIFGDARGDDPRDAYSRAARPSVWWSNIALIACAVGFVATTNLLLAIVVDCPVIVPVEVIVFAIGALVPGLVVLLRDVELKRYRRARAMLWLLRLSFPCGLLVAPLLELWAVRIRAGRRGLKAAVAPDACLRSIGLTTIHTQLVSAAMRELGLISAEDLDARRPTVRPGSDDELQLILDELELRARRGSEDDPRAEIEERLARRRPTARSPAEPLAWALVAVERRDRTSPSQVYGAYRILRTVSIGMFAFHGHAGHVARAHARCGQIDDALRALTSCPALLQSDEKLYDAAAGEIEKARGRLAT